MRLLGAIELFGLGVFRPAMDEGGLQSLRNESLAHPRETVERLISRALAILVSGQASPGASSPSSALSRMRAWVNWRAGAWPRAIKPSSVPRSSPVKITGFSSSSSAWGRLLVLAAARPPERVGTYTVPEEEYCRKSIMSEH